MQLTLPALVAHPRFEALTIGVIVVNALILAAETMVPNGSTTLFALKIADKLCLTYFITEITLRMTASVQSGEGLRGFFKKGWNVFDVVTTLAAFIPGLGALRTLRLLRIVAKVEAFRDTVEDLLHACQRSASLLGLVVMLLFIGALTATLAYQYTLPELYGNLAQSFITMFGFMLGDNVSENIRNMWAIDWRIASIFMVYVTLMAILVLSLVVSIVIEVAQARQKQRVGEDE